MEMGFKFPGVNGDLKLRSTTDALGCVLGLLHGKTVTVELELLKFTLVINCPFVSILGY